MIKFLIDLVFGIPTWLLSQIPSLPLPAQLTGTGPGTLVGGIESVAASAGAMDAWLPMGDAVQALGLVLASFLFALAVKLVRIVASFLTGGGGAAA